MAVRTVFSVDTGEWDFDQQCWIPDGRLHYQRPLSGKTLQLSADMGASFANEDYTGYFYDVPREYATPLHPVCSSDSGCAVSGLAWA